MADAFLESLVAREIEKAWREGWRVGYRSGCLDGRNSFDCCDPEEDWRNSETRAALSPAGDEK